MSDLSGKVLRMRGGRSHGQRWIVATACVLIALLLPAVADGFERLRHRTRRDCSDCRAGEMCDSGSGLCLGRPLSWGVDRMPVAWTLNASGSGLPAGRVRAELQRAFAAWSSVACTALRFREVSSDRGPWSSEEDAVNRVYWQTSGWTAGRHVLAVTWSKSSPDEGRLVDADIVFNGQDWRWTTGQCTGGEAYCAGGEAADLMSVALHEIGHFIGLDHSRAAGAVMTPGYDAPRQRLSADDARAVCAAYPAPGGRSGPLGAACVRSEDCLDGLSCLVGDVDGVSACTRQCTGDSGCERGYVCRASRGGGRACLPPTRDGQRRSGESCASARECRAGLTCVQAGLEGRVCLQPCGTGGGCPAGSRCAPSDAGGVAYCLPEAREGAACGASVRCEPGSVCLLADPRLGKVCHAACDPDSRSSRCGEGRRCARLSSGRGACVAAGRLGEECAERGCATGLACVRARGGGGAVCRLGCDPSRPGRCAAGTACVELHSGEAACVPAVGEGEDCARSACGAGLVCVRGEVGARCRAACDPRRGGRCGEGLVCESMRSGEAACVRAAASGGDCARRPCPEGELCVREGGGRALCRVRCDRSRRCGRDEACIDFDDGTSACMTAAEEGASCARGRCQEGLVCVRGPGGALCRAGCDPRRGGKDCRRGERCASLSAGGGACVEREE